MPPSASGSASAAIAVRLVGTGLTALVSLGTTAVILRHLGLADSGRYFAAVGFVLVLFAVSDQNLASVALRDSSGQAVSRSQADHTQRTILGFRLAAWTLMWGVASISIVLARVVENATFASLTVYVWITSLIVVGAMQVPAQTRMRQYRTAALLFVQGGVSLAAALWLAHIDAPLWPFLGVQVPGLLVCLIFLLRDPEATSAARPIINREVVGDLLRSNRSLWLATVFAVLANRAPVPLTLWLGGDDEAGILGAGFRVADSIESLAPLCMVVLLPMITRRAERSPRELARTLALVSGVMLPLGVAVGGAFGLWGHRLVEFMGGPQFADLDGVCRSLGLFLLFAFAAQPANHILLATRRHRALLITCAASAAVLAAAMLATVAQWGATGAAASLAGSFAVMAALSVSSLWSGMLNNERRRVVLPLLCASVMVTPTIAFAPPVLGTVLCAAVVLFLAAYGWSMHARPKRVNVGGPPA